MWCSRTWQAPPLFFFLLFMFSLCNACIVGSPIEWRTEFTGCLLWEGWCTTSCFKFTLFLQNVMHHILQAQSQPTRQHATLVYSQCPNLVRGPLWQDAITLVTWIQLCVQTGDVAREPRQGGRLCRSFQQWLMLRYQPILAVANRPSFML